MIGGEGNSSTGELGTIDWGGIAGAAGAMTAGGGTDLPPAELPFLASQDKASMVTVGGKCFEVEPVNPEAAILDLRDFG